jgi:hypothetical protein
MKRRLLAIIFISGLLFSMAASFILPKTAAADPASDIKNATFTFQDSANIIGDFGASGKIDFVDKNPSDSIANYAPTSGNFCNPDKNVTKYIGINLSKSLTPSNIYDKSISAALWLGYPTTTKVGVNTQTKCNDASRVISIDNPGSAAQYGLQWDGSNITTLNGVSGSETFAQATGTNNLFIDSSTPSNGCGNVVALDSGSTDKGTFYVVVSSDVPGGIDLPSNIASALGPGCKMVVSGPVAIKGTQGVSAATPGGAAGAASSPLGCEGTNSPLTWIICPVINLLVDVINGVDGIITREMNVGTDKIFCDSTPNCQAYYTAWQSFRDIALGLMAIAGLVIVIAQALGMEILDAYTIRKALPRVLIAALGITLSWPLMRFLIQLSDDLGFGVSHLILFPFSTLHGSIDLSILNGIPGGLFSLGVIGVGATAWLVLGGFGVLMSYAATAALAVLVAVLVLMLRQVAIILMLLLAPIAIVMYILPNTQRVYRLWWESFSKALLMFPLIAAFIATGRVFSAISFHNGSGGVNQLIGLVAYFAPYFMIPLTFRMAGSTMSGLGNLVQSRAQGGFQGLSGYRGQQRKSRLERVRGRGLYRKETGIPGALNKLGHYTWNADEKIPYALGSQTGLGAIGRVGGKRNPLGWAGRKAFGRMAGEQANIKAGQFAEQTGKGVEQAKNHYSTDWALLGLRHRLAGGMSATGRQAMDDKYGLKQNDEGQWAKTQAGEEATLWRAPENGDYHGLLEYGSDLRTYGEAGSMAQYAGVQLDEGRVGTLTSFGKHMETQRASVQSVALTSAARAGKLNHEEAILALDPMRKSPDLATRAFAQAQQAQMEQVAQGPRQDWRPGKGMRFDEEGNPYNVHGDTPVRELQGDGSSYAMVPAYKTAEAYASSNSMKGSAAMGAKAETIRNQKKTILSMATSERPELLKEGEAEAMRSATIAGSMNSYSDADSQLAWKEILQQLPPPTPEEQVRAQREIEEQHRRQGATGGGTPQPPAGGTAPPLIPPGGVIPPFTLG